MLRPEDLLRAAQRADIGALGSRRPGRPRKLCVRTCSLVDCVGGLEGCNGSECRRDAAWQKMTVAEFTEHFGHPPAKR